MDNMYPPRGGGDRDWPTEQIGSMAGQGHAEPRAPARSDEPGGTGGTGGTRRRLRQGVAVAAAVVRAQDGTTWTWDLVSNTVVRQHARRAATSALSAGQHVFGGGPVTGQASEARPGRLPARPARPR